jgi:hypothetical protein
MRDKSAAPRLPSRLARERNGGGRGARHSLSCRWVDSAKGIRGERIRGHTRLPLVHDSRRGTLGHSDGACGRWARWHGEPRAHALGIRRGTRVDDCSSRADRDRVSERNHLGSHLDRRRATSSPPAASWPASADAAIEAIVAGGRLTAAQAPNDIPHATSAAASVRRPTVRIHRWDRGSTIRHASVLVPETDRARASAARLRVALGDVVNCPPHDRHATALA